MSNRFTVYFGGELFNHKDLIGNALLSSYIEKISKGQYQCFLPQELDQASATALDIRNHDLKKIIECDFALFNFEGTELDSGTVVEFVFAKFLDIPSVILRTDFRVSGEKDLGGEDWNLMCSFYPRTHTVQFSAMELYHEALQESGSFHNAMDCFYSRVASLVVEGLDSVKDLSPVYKGDKRQLNALYQWAATFPSGGLEKLFSKSSDIEQIVMAKIKKKLL